MQEGDRILILTSFTSLSNMWTLHALTHCQTLRNHRSTHGEVNYKNASSIHGGVCYAWQSSVASNM